MAGPLDIAAEHAGLVAQLRAAGTPYHGGQNNDSYSGSGHPFFNVAIPRLRQIGRAWLAGRRKAADAELLAVVSSLFTGEAYEEKVLAAILLGAANVPRMRGLGGAPALADDWLDHLQGWAEIDSLCAGVFGPEEMEADWPGWRDLIRRLSRDPNIPTAAARRLVLLTRPTRTSVRPALPRPGVRARRAAEVRAADSDHQGGLMAAALDGSTPRRGGRRLSGSREPRPAGDRRARDANQTPPPARNPDARGRDLKARPGAAAVA